MIVLGGLVAALWKDGVIERVGPEWTAIGIVIAGGLGFMIAVARSGNKETVEIDRCHSHIVPVTPRAVVRNTIKILEDGASRR